MIALIACVALAVALLVWLGQIYGARAYTAYRRFLTAHAHRQLSDFFLFLNPVQLWSFLCLLAAAVAVVVYVLAGTLFGSLAVGALVLAAPLHLLAYVRARRLARIDQQLPDFLMALAGALRSGVGLSTALRHIGDRTGAPLGQELGLLQREQRLGVSLQDSLLNLQRRVPTETLGLMVSALVIASQNGGSLGQLLEEMAATFRARLQLKGRIHALTAQGRLPAVIMASLPLLLGVALAWIDPDSMRGLWETPWGWGVLGLVLVLEGLGLVLIRRIVAIEV